MNRYDQAIEDLLITYNSIALAKSYLHELKLQVEKEHKRVKQIERLLDKSEIKFARKNLLKSFLKGIQKKNGRLLNFEKEHYYNLALKLNAAQKFIEISHYEIEVLEEKIRKEELIQLELSKKIKARAIEIESYSNPKKQDLLKLIERIENRLGLQKEMEEALEAGDTLLHHFKELKLFLFVMRARKQVRGGEMRNFVGISIFKLEQLQTLISNTRKYLIKYEQEKKDIYAYVKLEGVVRTNLHNEFTNNFYLRFATNNLFSEKFTDTVEYVDSIISMIESNQELFRKDYLELQEIIAELRKEKVELFIQLNN